LDGGGKVTILNRGRRGGAEDEVERRLCRFLDYHGSLDWTEPNHVDPQINDGILDGRVPETPPELLLGFV
jgi:hypothetical protein